ncbi:MAG: chorismate-binding protein [Bacteroidota bacterium]
MFSSPSRVIRADGYDEVEGALRQLDNALEDGSHVAGMFAYEAGYALEPELFADPPAVTTPLVWFGVYDAPSRVDEDVLLARQPVKVNSPVFRLSRGAYRERIARIKACIQEGEVYQINLTAPFDFRTEGDALDVFAALRARQNVAYGALLRLPDLDVVSVSPELFFRVDAQAGERKITARPMKGTTPRGPTPESDAALVNELVSREKDRAENVMIVDLLRNDVSRVSQAGSVRVPTLFEPERYETLTQMTSTVKAQLRPDVGLADPPSRSRAGSGRRA